MRVKQRLRINAFVAVFSVIAVLAVFLAAAHRIIGTMETMQLADAFITASFEGLLLRTDYAQTDGDRAREQMFAKHGQIGKMLQAAAETFMAPDESETVAALIKGHESIGKILRTIVENRQTAGEQKRAAGFAHDVEERLLNQLNIRMYEAVLLGTKLQESANEALLAALGTAGGETILVLVFAGAGILINSWATGRAITDRVGRLRGGAELIGAGNLDYKIDVKGNDEIAELAVGFNEMSAKLRGSYSDLEKEIDVRKRAEEALARARDELELRVEERTKELIAAEAELKKANETLERRVGERTAELTAANEALRASRAAALNLMDDAVSARKRAEAASEEVQREIAERRKAEEQLQRSVENLRQANEELARFNRLAVGRELRMIELKEEVNAISTRLGQPPLYPPRSSPASGT